MQSSYVVGRQPIFDAARQVVGYELLFRGADVYRTAESMTADVLVRAGLDMGLDSVVGDRLAFVNLADGYLFGDLEVPFPAEQTVLEVSRDAPRGDALLDACQRLATAGFTIALDDHRADDLADLPLLEVASVVKIDVAAQSPAEQAVCIERCRSHGVRVLALHVETPDDLESATALGYDLFQGHLLSRPELVVGRSLTPNRLTVLRLIEKVCDLDTPTSVLEDIVESDAGLAQRLLRVAGAGARNGVRRSVRSIREAVVLLGRQRLRSWLLLMLASDADPTAIEQVSTAMTRAKMSELLAREVQPELADSAFTVGLVSGLDVILGAPLADIVEQLALDPLLVEALLERSGPLGVIHNDVLAWELGVTWLRSPLTPDVVERGYLEALRWTNGLTATLSEAA